MGLTQPWDETDSTGIGIVETTRAVSFPSDSDQSETVLLKPEDSAEMYPTEMLRGLSLVSTPCSAVWRIIW